MAVLEDERPVSLSRIKAAVSDEVKNLIRVLLQGLVEHGKGRALESGHLDVTGWAPGLLDQLSLLADVQRCGV